MLNMFYASASVIYSHALITMFQIEFEKVFFLFLTKKKIFFSYFLADEVIVDTLWKCFAENSSPKFMSVISCTWTRGKWVGKCVCMPHKWLPAVSMLVSFSTEEVNASHELMQQCPWDSGVLCKSTVFPKDLWRVNQLLNTSLLSYALKIKKEDRQNRIHFSYINLSQY